ncbi:MAG: pyridoxal phosphate-dependent aminotransferase [Maricaulaceae bacterium]
MRTPTQQPSNGSNPSDWHGRFPQNDIISLLQVNRSFNLAESTSQDLYFGELVDLIGLDAVRNIRLGYGNDQGLPLLRDAIGKMVHIAPEKIITTTGAALAIYLLAIELCRPKDEVVLFTPCFATSKDAFIGADVTLRSINLKFEDNYRVDLNAFEATLTQETKLVCLATPQNPSGVTTSFETVDAMLKIMERCAPNAYLFIDEVYLYASYGEAVAPKSLAALSEKIISCGSVSKSFGAPGLRVGWMNVHDEDLRARLITAKMNIVISGSPLNETLAAHLLMQRGAILSPRKALLKSGLERVRQWQNQEADRIAWVKPDAGALCCIRLKESAFDDGAIQRFWAAHAEHKLQLGNGEWFGESRRICRLGFGYLPLSKLPKALRAVSDVLDFVQRSSPA